ncbi:MAG TPA: phenylacetate-CoA oxygenase subunit PaaC [Bacteroidia bacterium]|jgi:ring-1,2-phenylacetyl-CoA epoxidase subunit PaaC|uniref:1,2-phenylacetyl-CoA epoxidase subunit PaaC n=1 Tax=Candidatus Pollutiaquabacter sp. TaxID=3416354 RepID=UPI002BA1B675|nr:phenylacetate-CoA oxygenase subunit PaaC [Bacteroidota bacterium]HRS37923.1 phenylacetate-CoA oxygenase subunit PaaC [Bacteroidia bacterium]HRU60939.1 phenylacetate-CoA oxygenase subunit PaaC [Bacteroidia bacterium]
MTKQEALFEYCLRIGDTGVVLGQRLGEWCGHGPVLEEDIAMTNIALDLIGQARGFLTYAGEVEGKGRSEDDLAYMRSDREYRNVLLAEQPNGDFAVTMMRQFLISAFYHHFFQALTKSKDSTLAALGEKSLKEVTYHLRHSRDWMLRLGQGTEESRRRLLAALDELWTYTGDLFDMDTVDELLVREGIGVDLKSIRPLWEHTVRETFTEAEIPYPADSFMQRGSRDGRHTEHLGHLLSELQILHRSIPNAQW